MAKYCELWMRMRMWMRMKIASVLGDGKRVRLYCFIYGEINWNVNRVGGISYLASNYETFALCQPAISYSIWVEPSALPLCLLRVRRTTEMPSNWTTELPKMPWSVNGVQLHFWRGRHKSPGTMSQAFVLPPQVSWLSLKIWGVHRL